jgi:hypothetical protein
MKPNIKVVTGMLNGCGAVSLPSFGGEGQGEEVVVLSQ